MKYPHSRIERTARLAIAAAVAVGAGAMSPTAASALTAPDVTVDGVALAGSTRVGGVFDVAVAAPAGVKVKFRLDGSYLGQDATAPYTWPVRTTTGAHTVNVRWDDATGRHETDVTFTVSAAPAESNPGTSKPAPTASPTPTPTPTPTSTP
ncbi:Ig-like domain-containing protein, partial [Microbacterium sp. Bi128]|uniref:Ig-like domain-containing protein n=1 Tax=Microbacterium sp. Bi128 TaxID=2821115 RepID=UPI0035AB8363